MEQSLGKHRVLTDGLVECLLSLDVPAWPFPSCLSPISAQMPCHGGLEPTVPASASQQHPPCLSRVKSDSLARLRRFWKTLPSLLRDPGLGSVPGLEQLQALGAQCGWSCVNDTMLMAPLSLCAAGPCHRDQVLLIPHLPGVSLGMLQHVLCAVQAAPERFELFCWCSDFSHGWRALPAAAETPALPSVS